MTALGIDPVITETGTVLRLSGELDLATVADAEDALVADRERGSEAASPSISATSGSSTRRGCGSSCRRTRERSNTTVRSRSSGRPTPVHRVFVLTRLDERLPFEDAADPLPGKRPMTVLELTSRRAA